MSHSKQELEEVFHGGYGKEQEPVAFHLYWKDCMCRKEETGAQVFPPKAHIHPQCSPCNPHPTFPAAGEYQNSSLGMESDSRAQQGRAQSIATETQCSGRAHQDITFTPIFPEQASPSAFSFTVLRTKQSHSTGTSAELGQISVYIHIYIYSFR